ncbi:DedA family protein [Micromonospora sp. NPDC051006]|uniref:DedA family protein n=1 Tax=Micromonospora sp. NPDC051006 TaxID=3364283 RepID=UPI0037975C58
MTRLTDWLLALRGVGVYLLVGLLVFAEDALFIGFLLPGETAAILGGVAASRGHVDLVAMIAVVVGAAIIGDSAGYEVGRHLGPRLLRTRPLRRREQRIDAARDLLARRGGAAVFLGRFVAFLRAVMPALAGTAHMPYRTFLAFNAAGALVWGTGTVVLGYFAGNSYSTIEKTFGRAAALIILAIAVAAVITWRIRRHTAQQHTFSPPAEPGGRAHDTD